jgi:hypothetical protein
MEELKAIVLRGPNPKRHKVVRWRCVDLREEIAARWSVTVCEQTVGKWLRQLRMTRSRPRPYHPKKDLEAAVAYKSVWPAPSASDFSDPIQAVCVNVSGLWARPRPRWRSARPGPHKLHGVERHFLNQVSRTPIDCQAISLSPPADINGRAASSVPSADIGYAAAPAAAASNDAPRRNTAHTIRASLLARATMAALLRTRFSNPRSQPPSGVALAASAGRAQRSGQDQVSAGCSTNRSDKLKGCFV